MFKKKTYTDYVDLSIGRVYIKPLTNKILNNATIYSTIKGSELNNALFYTLIEKNLLVLKKRLYNSLSVEDGDKVRSVIINILKRHGVVKESNDKVFEDEWFKKSMTEGLNRVKERFK